MTTKKILYYFSRLTTEAVLVIILVRAISTIVAIVNKYFIQKMEKNQVVHLEKLGNVKFHH